jgi:hypothetical protein
MKNRFDPQQKNPSSLRGVLLPVVLFVLLIALFIQGVASVSATSSDESVKSLTTAVEHAMVHCYATEGHYPDNVTYMEEHYGLTYDKARYRIDYTTYGTNLVPDVTVIPLGGAS